MPLKMILRIIPRWETLIICFLPVLILHSPAWARDKTESPSLSIDAIIQRIQERHSLHLFYKEIPDLIWPKVIGTPAEESDYVKLLEYLKLFEKEISHYPPSFFQKARLKGVVFVKRFFFKDHPVDGLYDYRRNIIFFDFVRSRGNPIAQRHNIHHELYHFIAIQVKGDPKWEDRKWAEFNEKSFQYGSRRSPGQNKNSINPFAPGEKGFMTNYAMSSIKEDKAEIYACLMVPSQNKLMHKWIKNDPILGKKAEDIKSFVFRFCPDMNEEYYRGMGR